MQPKIILFLLAASITLFSISSCKKDQTKADGEIETTFDLSGKQAISESLTDDDNNILQETTESEGLSGNREPILTMGTTSCATITVSPGSFPKTITVDFGNAGCTNSNSTVIRSGIIHIVLSDSLRTSGSIAVLTFENYFVNGYKKEGTITWTNTSTSGTRSWTREVVGGKITAPDGRYWFHSGVKQITQVEGINTPRTYLDDAFSITGTSTITNSSGVSRIATIQTPLQKKVNCAHIDQGIIRFEGPNHFATLNFGEGTCDDIAFISFDGYSPRQINLP